MVRGRRMVEERGEPTTGIGIRRSIEREISRNKRERKSVTGKDGCSLFRYFPPIVIPYDKKTRVEIECKLIRIVNSELRLKGAKDKPSLQMDGLQEQRVFACLRF